MFAIGIFSPCEGRRISLINQRRYTIGAWRSPVSALVWETRGRRFKSSRSDQFFSEESATIRTSGAGCGGRGSSAQSAIAGQVSPEAFDQRAGDQHFLSLVFALFSTH